MPDDCPAVVFDINVFINAIVGEDSQFPYLAPVPPSSDNADADALSLMFDADDMSLFVSPHIMRNVVQKLTMLGVTRHVVETFIDLVYDVVENSGGEVLDPPRKVFDVVDFEDNLIMDLAVACDAGLVVSEGTDLASLSPWNNRVVFLRPREFVSRIVQLRRLPRPRA